jgi:hypothetical protein
MFGRLPAHCGIELVTGIDTPESCRGRHLIVPAPPGVQLRRDLSDLRVQKPVDHRVYVFVGRNRRGASAEALRDRVESRLDPATLIDREHTCIPQRHSPGLRQSNIEWP